MMETIIGLEVHVKLDTRTKIFCGCSTQFGNGPNTQVCPICLGLPGTLPVLNRAAVENGIKAGLALHCDINPVAQMARKHYFYPDLPKDYQITQSAFPICLGGYVDIETDGKPARVRLHHIHIEEDAGKLIHDRFDDQSEVDYNRGGSALIEIVTMPDLRSAEQARDFLTALRSILTSVGVAECKMQEGGMRCDVNISVREKGSEAFNARVEMKNLNSIRSAMRAIQFESRRQQKLCDKGEAVAQETRLWDDVAGHSRSMRTKEDAQDYRYFPDPDLPSFIIEEAYVEKLRAELPELPEQKKARYQSGYGLSEYAAAILTGSRALYSMFEQCVALNADPKRCCNVLMGDISALLNEKELEDIPFPAEHLVKVLELSGKGTLNTTLQKKVLALMFEEDDDPETLLKKHDLLQMDDPDAMRRIMRQVIDANPKSVADYKAGKKQAATYLMGQAMRASKGKANPQVLLGLIADMLGE